MGDDFDAIQLVFRNVNVFQRGVEGGAGVVGFFQIIGEGYAEFAVFRSCNPFAFGLEAGLVIWIS